jgi:cation:H+ antiporter
MFTTLLLLSIGVAALTIGGWYLVRGASSIAVIAKVPLPVIGLTVVAMGTSVPELAVSISAAAAGSTDIAFGNVVGSNILNIAIVLALAGLISDIAVNRNVFRVEYPFMVAATVLVMFLASDGSLDRSEGFGLVALLVVFTVYMVKSAKEIVPADETSEFETVAAIAEDHEEGAGTLLKYVWFLAVGIAALVFGAKAMVSGAIRIAEVFGISERIIGLTIVSLGTSLPEVATTMVAAFRKEHDLVVGNIIGSNLFNLLGILGLTAFFFPVPVRPEALSYDVWIMLGFSVLLLPILWFRKKVSKRDGALLLVLFGFYLWFLINR